MGPDCPGVNGIIVDHDGVIYSPPIRWHRLVSVFAGRTSVNGLRRGLHIPS